MDKLIQILDEIGLPWAYSHFAKGEVPDFPYLCVQIGNNDPFSADGIVYQDFLDVDLELYTDHKDLEAERKVQDVLTKHEIYYARSETWISSEELYQVWFSFEMEDE